MFLFLHSLVFADAPPCVVRKPNPCSYGGMLSPAAGGYALLVVVLVVFVIALGAVVLVRRRRRRRRALAAR